MTCHVSTLCSISYIMYSRISSNVTCVLQCVAGCCSVVQCVAVCCSVLQCVAVCGSVLLCTAGSPPMSPVCCNVLPCAAVCCRVLQCVAVCCRVLPCAAVCCSAAQCVAVRFVLQRGSVRVSTRVQSQIISLCAYVILALTVPHSMCICNQNSPSLFKRMI